jgi:hypothetical protein
MVLALGRLLRLGGPPPLASRYRDVRRVCVEVNRARIVAVSEWSECAREIERNPSAGVRAQSTHAPSSRAAGIFIVRMLYLFLPIPPRTRLIVVEVRWPPILRLPYRRNQSTRHTFATWLLSDSADLWVQGQLGHASTASRPTPTARYSGNATRPPRPGWIGA